MKVLITGSNGFIGKYLCDLLKNEHDIIGIDIDNNSKVKKIDYISGQIHEKTFVDNVYNRIKNCDVIIHLAALIDYDDSNEELIDVNCRGTLNILKLSEKLSSKKIIYLSSLPVIGEPVYLPIKEDAFPNPGTLYHCSKLMGEYILNLSKKKNTQNINLRIPSPVGAGMNEHTILPIFIKKCMNDEPIILYGQGTRKQNYIDVRDITSCIAQLIDKDICGTLNLCSKTVISNYQLAEICVNITKSKSSIQFNGMEDPLDNLSWEASTAKIEEAIGFEQKFNIEESIYDIFNYYLGEK